MMRVVSLPHVAEQLWRNGGGITRELLAWPSTQDWALRISVARIAQDGPFSAFPGISRCFTVLGGHGVELSWQDRTVQLHLGSEPLQFGGEDPPVCRLLNGPTEDLNLMLAERRAKGKLVPAQDGSTLGGAWRGLYTACACTLQAGRSWPLAAHSLAWDDDAGTSPPWGLDGVAPGQAWWVDVEVNPS